jgi:ATP-dependent RNA helicase DeaD
VMDTTTEFEISERVAESFAVKIRRPDKEDNIRIEALAEAPQAQAAADKRPHTPRRDVRESDRNGAPSDRSRDERAPKPYGKPHGGKSHSENAPGFDRAASFKAKKRHPDKPAYAGKARHDRGSLTKPAFGKKPKKKFRG